MSRLSRMTFPATRTVLGASGVVVALAVVLGAAELRAVARPELGFVLTFMLVIAAGETARLSLLGRRETAPLSTAAALGLAMSTLPMHGGPQLGSAAIIAAVGVAMTVGASIRHLFDRPVSAGPTSARFLGVAVACLLYRQMPSFDGGSLLEWSQTLVGKRWLVAIVMLLVSTVAIIVELALEGAIRAETEHSRLLSTVRDEVSGGVSISIALVTTGALVALAETALGLAALPLFLFPLLLTQFAVRRYGAVRETYRQTILALSGLTELSGYTRLGHASRVSDLSLSIGRDLGMPQRDVVNLEYAALLHDLGQVALRDPIPGGATVMAAPADQRRIARDGADIVRQTGVLDAVAEILETQTTPYRQVREFGEDLPLASRIIKVANAFDDLVGPSPTTTSVQRAMERIHLGLGYEYDPQVVDSLSRVVARRTLDEPAAAA